MKPSYRPALQSRSLVAVLVGYLVAILLFQGLAAAHAMGAGPVHRHGATTLATAPAAGKALVLFSHHLRADTQPHADAHTLVHANGQRHHHVAADPSVVLDAAAQQATDASTQALAATLALLALQTTTAATSPRGHERAVATAWAWRTVPARLLYRPPRQA